eukprot:15448686-Alexandrium_andersonii.AAC.1
MPPRESVLAAATYEAIAYTEDVQGMADTRGIKLPAPNAPHAPHLCGARDVVRRHTRHIFVARE